MRIVDRNAFLAMQEGTVFAKFEPCVFDGLLIKGASVGNDFLFQSIVDAVKCGSSEEFGELLEHAARTGASIPMDFECLERDGCFDVGQLFAVFEEADVRALVRRLERTLTGPVTKTA